MKNAIQYYYGLYPEDIHQSNGSYQFIVQDEHYYLTPYYRSLEELQELYKISSQLFSKGIYCHQFIRNGMQELITVIHRIPYVLLRVFLISDQPVTVKDILFFSNLTMTDTSKSTLKRNHWKQLWSEKNDYFEYQVSQFGKQFPKIRESFSYFIGLSEIGISLLNEGNYEMPLVISHKRISRNDTIFDLYNPLNFILDYKERDFIEFWKEELLEDDFSIEEFEESLPMLSFTQDELLLLLARAFYPTFYFDRYEQILNMNQKEEILDIVLQKIDQYEHFLSFLYMYAQVHRKLPDLLWLEKK